MNKPAKLTGAEAPFAYQAAVRCQHLVADNAAEFNAARVALSEKHYEVRCAIDRDWLNLSAADFLAKYS